MGIKFGLVQSVETSKISKVFFLKNLPKLKNSYSFLHFGVPFQNKIPKHFLVKSEIYPDGNGVNCHVPLITTTGMDYGLIGMD